MKNCKTRITLLACVALLPAAAHAADKNNRFVVLGFGSESCGTYVTDRAKGEDNPYRGWITGYLSSYNEHTRNTYNVLGSTDVNAVMLWLENYCKQQPLQSFSDAAGALLSELIPRKQSAKP